VANPTKVAEAPYGMLGGCLEMYQLYTPAGKLPDNIRFIHLWANASDGFWTGIDEQYIETSDHLYARLVRGVLSKEERQPWAEPEMTVGRWLFARGQHYAAMFDVLKAKDCRHIMEIGTYNGQNALLMIKTAARRVPEEEIAYYGFDVFEDYTPEIEDLEFSVGYKPPKVSEVEEYLKKHTTAGIHLFRGKSRETLSHEISHLPKMDFIYVDGGHSIETIRKDWWYVQQLTTSASIVVFDDYYDDMPFIGCKFLVGELGDKYQGQLMREADEYAAKWGKLKTQLFMVRQRTEVPGPIIPVRRPVLHVLGLAHTQTSKEYNACAYTSKTLKFCGMLKRLGYEVIHYGAEGSNPDATENVEVLSTLTQRRCYGDYDWKKEQFRHDPKDLAYQTFNKYAIVEINKRKGPRDILCITMGNYQKPIADGVQLTTVETGIGYTGIFCDKRIFESYAWLNYILGVLYPNSGGVVGPFNYDCVIPNFFEPSDFEFRDHKDDYYLFMGRLMPNKGVHIAFQTCERIGAKLKIAGQGTIETIKSLGLDPAKVEFVGYADTKMRSELMSHAKAIFVPTLYLGPFEGVAIEANFSGTPSICTPFGVFAETIQHGKTGFRCHTMDDFVFAAKHVDELDPYYIHDYAVNNYSVDRVGLMYDEYFTKVQDLWYAGWYEIHPERTQLDWLKRWHEHGDDSAGVPGRVGVSCDGLKK
jgi:glycosyltransferase involved in cell wall biosynthesis